MRINIGESIPVKVVARKPWNDPGIEVLAGEEYEFTVEGKWRDLTVKCDAGGYTSGYMRTFDKWKRSKDNNWFALMGSVNRENDFLVGTGTKKTMNYSGVLSFYANDVKGFYWNNFGSVEVRVKKIS